MIPLFVIAVVFGILFVAGRLGVQRFRSWVVVLRWSLAAMFLFTGYAHFGTMRPELVRMVPPFLPAPEVLVTLTGVAELAGAVGLLIPRLARWAGLSLALLMICMFPANVHAANEQLTLNGMRVLGVWPRAVLQLLYVGAALAAALGPTRESGPDLPRSEHPTH